MRDCGVPAAGNAAELEPSGRPAGQVLWLCIGQAGIMTADFRPPGRQPELPMKPEDPGSEGERMDRLIDQFAVPGRKIATAYMKQPVEGPLWLGTLGLVGDEHVFEAHGGPDRAVLAYASEHFPDWESRLGFELPEFAAFGENLTLRGLLETTVHIGDVFEIGGAQIQATQPRGPCYKPAARYGVREMTVLMRQTGHTGILFRVLREGLVTAGDSVRLIAREDHGISVAEANTILFDRRDADGARRLLAIPTLAVSRRNELVKRLAKATRPD